MSLSAHVLVPAIVSILISSLVSHLYWLWQYRRTRSDARADARADLLGTLARLQDGQRPAPILIEREVQFLQAAALLDPLIAEPQRTALHRLAQEACGRQSRDDRTHAMDAVRALQRFVHDLP